MSAELIKCAMCPELFHDHVSLQQHTQTHLEGASAEALREQLLRKMNVKKKKKKKKRKSNRDSSSVATPEPMEAPTKKETYRLVIRLG